MWARWRKGDSLQQIAQLFDRNRSSVEQILSETGEIEPRQRHRSEWALTLAECEVITVTPYQLHQLMLTPSLVEKTVQIIKRHRNSQLLVDADGQSRISYEDYAVAMFEEIEHPAHIRQRFCVAY